MTVRCLKTLAWAATLGALALGTTPSHAWAEKHQNQSAAPIASRVPGNQIHSKPTTVRGMRVWLANMIRQEQKNTRDALKASRRALQIRSRRGPGSNAVKKRIAAARDKTDESLTGWRQIRSTVRSIVKAHKRDAEINPASGEVSDDVREVTRLIAHLVKQHEITLGVYDNKTAHGAGKSKTPNTVQGLESARKANAIAQSLDKFRQRLEY